MPFAAAAGAATARTANVGVTTPWGPRSIRDALNCLWLSHLSKENVCGNPGSTPWYFKKKFAIFWGCSLEDSILEPRCQNMSRILAVLHLENFVFVWPWKRQVLKACTVPWNLMVSMSAEATWLPMHARSSQTSCVSFPKKVSDEFILSKIETSWNNTKDGYQKPWDIQLIPIGPLTVQDRKSASSSDS